MVYGFFFDSIQLEHFFVMNKSICVLYILALLSCKREVESPYNLAKKYCSCIEQQFKNSSDSLIDINECGRTTYAQSRFMNIQTSENRDIYNKTTLDSAFNFTIEVRNIEDTMCYNKIDMKRVKHFRHLAD
jgi:transcriptional regulator with PAS, ATPase and Fis domain